MNRRIFDLWLACWTAEEIAADVGVERSTATKLAEEFVNIGNLAKNHKADAEHAVDFTPPIYNIWKQQEKTADAVGTEKQRVAEVISPDLASLPKADKAAAEHAVALVCSRTADLPNLSKSDSCSGLGKIAESAKNAVGGSVLAVLPIPSLLTLHRNRVTFTPEPLENKGLDAQ